MTRVSLFGPLVVGLAVWCSAAPASAQPSAADRAAAAQAYDRGSAAYLARQYERAASMFETAYRVMPNTTALLQATRAHHRAGHGSRAATLAHRLLERFDVGEARSEIESIVAEWGPTLMRVELTAVGAPRWEVDGALQDEGDVAAYCPPGEHAVRVSFESGTVTRDIEGDAGAVVSVRAEAPPTPVVAASVAEPAAPPVTVSVSGPRLHAPHDAGLEPWLFVGLTSATAVAGGFLLAFGVDAWSGLDSYRDNPTSAGLADGQDRELRTNVMFGVTGGLAVAALISALVTDWDGDAPRPTAAVGVGSVALGVRGSLP